MMPKSHFFLYLLCLLSASGFGQDFPTKKSGQHQQIDGTNIFMIPPENFEPSSNFKGFHNPDDATSMIMAMTIPGPYSEIVKGFNAEMLATRGMKLTSKKEIELSDYKGVIIELDQPANGMVFSKQILIYGNENETTMINGIFPSDSLKVGNQIKKSLMTTLIDQNTNSNPREALDFSVDENAGGLKFVSVIGNGMLFNRDLKTPTESADKATLIVDKSFEKREFKDKKMFCIARVKNYPDDFSINPEKGINEISIGGIEGFELYANNNEVEEEEMYQVIVFGDDGGYFMFVGTYLKQSTAAITDIKNVIKTFTLKD